MNAHSEPVHGDSPYAPQNSWNTRVTLIITVTASLALGVILWFAIFHPGTPINPVPTSPSQSAYPFGTPDISEPSGMSPPSANALKGYVQIYVNDFLGTRVPHGWDVFTGVPGGDPGGQFASSHVVVSGGLLQLNAWKDPKYNDNWVTGGLCDCALSQTYGAYFVRSRATGAGPNEVELLWPASNVWPPEIDFNESGGTLNSTGATVHFTTANSTVQRTVIINMSEWHTWGVIWTPEKILYILDGKVWGSINVAYAIPDVPMTLDLEQRAECELGRQCPSQPVSMLVDWVAEYTAAPAKSS
jgi:hypothetical protein